MRRLAAPALLLLGGLALLTLVWATRAAPPGKRLNQPETTGNAMNSPHTPADESTEQATFGTGCFWCTEAIFRELKGVRAVVSGYSGGQLKNPTYEQVCTGRTGHAEVVQITFDPKVISFEELLEVFWRVHDPTTPNRQGADVGPQYRSAIFYHNDRQRQLAEEYKQKLNASGAFLKPIVTEITRFEAFYPAEDYHQQYYERHGRQPYCQLVIRPKLEKFRQVFAEKRQAVVK